MIVQQIVLQPRAPPCRTTTTVKFMHISVYTCISKVSCVWRLKACYSQSPSRCLSLAWFTIRLPRVITELTISNSDAAINNDASREGCMVVATSTVCVCVCIPLLSAVNYALFLTEFMAVCMYIALNAALPVCAAMLHWLNQSSINFFFCVLCFDWYVARSAD